MEKVRPWCGQPSDRGRLMNRTGSYEQVAIVHFQNNRSFIPTFFNKSFRMIHNPGTNGSRFNFTAKDDGQKGVQTH